MKLLLCVTGILSNLKHALCWCSFEGDSKESPGLQGGLSAQVISAVCAESIENRVGVVSHTPGPRAQRSGGVAVPSQQRDV